MVTFNFLFFRDLCLLLKNKSSVSPCLCVQIINLSYAKRINLHQQDKSNFRQHRYSLRLGRYGSIRYPRTGSAYGERRDECGERPTPQVSATAVLEKEEGRKLTFRITASDTKGTVGEATHIRYIVDRERFMSKL